MVINICFQMPRYLGLDYFKEASESYHKCISEYFLSEPWHLEQEKDAVYVHQWKTSRQLFLGLQPWKKVVPDVNFLAQEAQNIEQFAELLDGFNPFQCSVYKRLSGIIPSSLEEENVEGNSTNSQMSQTNLMRSLLINKSTEIRAHNLNPLKPELEKGHEKFLDEPILHDYLSELQCIQLRKEVKFEKVDISDNISDELQVNEFFLFTKYFPKKTSKDVNGCNDAIEEQRRKFHEQYDYQNCPPVQLTGDNYDHVLQEMCDVQFKNVEKRDARERQECHTMKAFFTTELQKFERCSTSLKVNENDREMKNEETQILPSSAKIADNLQETSPGKLALANKICSKSISQSKTDLEANSCNTSNSNHYETDAKIEEKYNQQTINVLEIKTHYQKDGIFDENQRVQYKKSLIRRSQKKHHEENDEISQLKTDPNDHIESPWDIKGSCNDISLQNFVPIAQNVESCHLTQCCLNDMQSKLDTFQSQGKETLVSENTSDSLQSVLLNLACQDNNSTDCEMSIKSDGEKEISSLTNQLNSEKSFQQQDSEIEIVPGNVKIPCLKNVPHCFIDDNHHDPPAKKPRKSYSSYELQNANINGEICYIETHSALHFCHSNPLDSFLFLRTGLVKNSKKEQKQEAEIKTTIAPNVERVSSNNVATTTITQNEPWVFKQEETFSPLLPITSICSTTFSEMTELIRNLELMYNVHFVERNYESIFNESHITTWPFVYSDLIVDEQTSIVLCQMEELQNRSRFMHFRRRIYNLLLKFSTCWIIVFELQKTPESLQAASWKSFTKLSLWASQMSSIKCDIRVKVVFSNNCCNMATTIRHICDYTITNNRIWKENQWVNRPWILPEISRHERFLLAFPCINSFNAQAMLGTMSIMQLMTSQLQDLVTELRCIPPKVLKMLYKIIHWKSPIHVHLTMTDAPFITHVVDSAAFVQGDVYENTPWRPNSSYPAFDCTNFQTRLDANPGFTLHKQLCSLKPEKTFIFKSQQPQNSSIPMVSTWLGERAKMAWPSQCCDSKSPKETIPTQPYLSVVTVQNDHLTTQSIPELSSHILESDYGKYNKEQLQAINTPSSAWYWNDVSDGKATRNLSTTEGRRTATRDNNQPAIKKKPLMGKLRYQKVSGNKGQTCLIFN